MSSTQVLREFINRRLTCAAVEIYNLFENTAVLFEAEMDRQRRLLERTQRRADFPQQEVQNQAANSSPQQVIPEPLLEEQDAEEEEEEEDDDDDDDDDEEQLEEDSDDYIDDESGQSEPEAHSQQLPSRNFAKMFINARLIAAAMDIFMASEDTIIQYEKEIDSRCRLLDMRADRHDNQSQLPRLQRTGSGVSQEKPELPQNKEDQEVPELPHSKEEEEHEASGSSAEFSGASVELLSPIAADGWDQEPGHHEDPGPMGDTEPRRNKRVHSDNV